ncbi:unnamed protein product, partial [Didymodactylos carnosus]
IRILFEKHYIETNSNLFSLYKVEKLNGNICELNDDDFPLILRVLTGPFNDTQFYIMEKGRSQTIPIEVSNYLVLPETMLKAFVEKFINEEIDLINSTKRKYLAYKQLLLKEFEKHIENM